MKYEIRIRWACKWLQEKISKISSDNCQQHYKLGIVQISAEDDDSARKIAIELEQDLVARAFILRQLSLARRDAHYTPVWKSEKTITFPNDSQPMPHKIAFNPFEEDLDKSETII